MNEIRIDYFPADITFAQYGIGNLTGVSFALWIQISTYNIVYSGSKIESIKFESKVGEQETDGQTRDEGIVVAGLREMLRIAFLHQRRF